MFAASSASSYARDTHKKNAACGGILFFFLSEQAQEVFCNFYVYGQATDTAE